MYDPMIYTDLIAEIEREKNKINSKQLFAVHCKSGFYQTTRFVASQRNSHSINNVLIDFNKKWPGFKINRITETDAFIY